MSKQRRTQDKSLHAPSTRRSRRILVHGQYHDPRALHAQLGLDKDSSEWCQMRGNITTAITQQADLSPNAPSAAQQGDLMKKLSDYVLKEYPQYFPPESRESDLKCLSRYISNCVSRKRHPQAPQTHRSDVSRLPVQQDASLPAGRDPGGEPQVKNLRRSCRKPPAREPEKKVSRPQEIIRPKPEPQEDQLQILVDSDPIYQFLNRSRPSLTHLYEGFMKVGCNSIGHLEAMADWPVDGIQMFFEKMKEVGTPLTVMDGLVLRLALKQEMGPGSGRGN
ncbi:hypothetical protein BDN72DRAFT_647785 [Pluteus cervinus]|uniref:Uncharacterized protein n=1 Tax=Pluteus cervinus TaxID=181527 RepID=A0ACD3A0C9_9AGAR|nr:hypothetical protein BDN72DRAFT_647785 [Pluteus cervinus]